MEMLIIFSKHRKNDGKIIRYDFWDLSGKEKYEDFIKWFFGKADVTILVYDKTNIKSFNRIKTYWIKEVKNIEQNIKSK